MLIKGVINVGKIPKILHSALTRNESRIFDDYSYGFR